MEAYMIISEYTVSRAEKLNIMNFFDMEFPLNLQILWMDILYADQITAPILIGNHNHTFHEIHIVYSGKCIYECNGENYEIEEKQALFIPSGTEHKYIGCDKNILKTSLAFSYEINSTFKNPIVRKMSISSKVIKNVDYILTCCDSIDIFTSTLAGGRIFEIIYDFLKFGDTQPPLNFDQNIDPRFPIAKQFIEKNLQRPITIEDVAKECCLSTKQLSRIFKNLTNRSLHEYIVNSKIKKAENLLIDTDKSIKEIGYSLGFDNECSFITFFKRHRYVTPGVFRKNKHF